jgi:hypothetical protein
MRELYDLEIHNPINGMIPTADKRKDVAKNESSSDFVKIGFVMS